MSSKPMGTEDYRGWRFICTTHEWMSNQVPCPAGDGTDRGPQEKP